MIDDGSESDLVRRACAGSEVAFAQIVRRYEGRLYNFHLRWTGCVADAEDLTQDTFARAWQHLDRYDPQRRFSTWLFTIAARQSATRHRSAQRQRKHLKIRATLESARGEPREPALVLEEARSVWSVAEAVLNADQRAGLWLRYFEDLKIEEIARVLGKTRVAVRVMLFRARERIAAEIRRRQETQAPASTAPAASRDQVLEARSTVAPLAEGVT